MMKSQRNGIFQLVTKCHQLKMIVVDGKQYLTDTVDVQTLLRLVQFVPSPKAFIY